MRTSLWIVVIATGLILFGCDSSEQSKAQKAPTAQPPVKAEEVTTVEDAKTVTPVVEATKVVADKVVEQGEQVVKRAEKAIEDADETASAAIDETVKIAENAIAAVEQQTVVGVTAVKSAMGEPVAATQKATAPQEIVLEASYGNVSFPHAMHADTYQCSTCHGSEAPEQLEMTKDIAHKLCKGCHKEAGSGPTGCSGCHIK